VSTDQPWTIGRLLDWTTQYLKDKGAVSPRLEAQVLLAHALKCSRTALYTRFEEQPTEPDRLVFRELVQRRVKGSPVAHLVGRKEFFSLEFEVGPAVLVPRADSEWVVTECLTLAKPMSAPRILDVGTGSGCLAVALAQQHKAAIVTAIDLSPDALAVARRNADRHKLGERIRFLEGDLFGPVPEGERFDFIVSNPPYIPTGAIPTLAPEVRDHEPHLALDGGSDGFAVIDRLLAESPNYLESGGYLLVEIGYDQEAAGRERFEKAGGWELGKTIQDGEGRARVLRARRG
jgi:release factor glutamine methyltransferase